MCGSGINSIPPWVVFGQTSGEDGPKNDVENPLIPLINRTLLGGLTLTLTLNLTLTVMFTIRLIHVYNY